MKVADTNGQAHEKCRQIAKGDCVKQTRPLQILGAWLETQVVRIPHFGGLRAKELRFVIIIIVSRLIDPQRVSLQPKSPEITNDTLANAVSKGCSTTELTSDAYLKLFWEPMMVDQRMGLFP